VSEFEIQQLVIETRWEFAVPSLALVFVSMGFMAVGIWRPGAMDRLSVRLLQVTYVVLVAFLAIRGYAAVLRAIKLTAVLRATIPNAQFDYMNPAVQTPTVIIRLAALVILLVVTLFLLNRAIKSDA
jgi:hypothetical protein